MLKQRLAAALAAAAVLLVGTAANASTTAGRAPAAATAPQTGGSYYFDNYPGGSQGGGYIWDNAGNAWTSHTYATQLTVTTLDIYGGQTTQLATADGNCLGPVNQGGTWSVQLLGVTACGQGVGRAVWQVSGYVSGSVTYYNFQSQYLANNYPYLCPDFTGPLLTATGAGDPMDFTCVGVPAGPAATFLATASAP